MKIKRKELGREKDKGRKERHVTEKWKAKRERGRREKKKK